MLYVDVDTFVQIVSFYLPVYKHLLGKAPLWLFIEGATMLIIGGLSRFADDYLNILQVSHDRFNIEFCKKGLRLFFKFWKREFQNCRKLNAALNST